MTGNTVVDLDGSQAPVSRDVPDKHSFADEITGPAGEDSTTGYKDGTFRPLNRISGEAMAAFLFRFQDPSTSNYSPAGSAVPDAPTDHAFYREISWLSENKITTGYKDGDFRPRGEITREATAAFLFRLDKLTS